MFSKWRAAVTLFEQSAIAVPWPVFLPVFMSLIFLHNPHALMHADFWGEDGPVWYTQAKQFGLASLLRTEGGYLNSLQRLAALAVQPLSLVWAPTLFVTFALIIQALPAAYLVSSRLGGAWPDKLSRVLFAVLYCLMPNAPETSMNVTDSQWYLALLAFLIIVSDRQKTIFGYLLDILVLLVSGLSGPFGIFLIPIAFFRVIRALKGQRTAHVWRLVVLVTTGAVQSWLISGQANAGRSSAALGATPALLIKILAMIPLGAELGFRVLSRFLNHVGTGEVSFIVAFIAVIVAGLFLVPAFFRGTAILKEFIFFASVVFALALAKPLISITLPQWPLILFPPSGNRYFLYPMIAWWGILFVLLKSGGRVRRAGAGVLLASTFFIAIPTDWGDIFNLPQTDFGARAEQFEQSQLGTSMEFSTHPSSVRMTLVQDRQPVPSALMAVNAMDMEATRQSFCALDTINGSSAVLGNKVFSRRDVISMVGWALTANKSRPQNLELVLSGSRSYGFKASSGVFRDDVVKAFGRLSARASGYSAAADLISVVPGIYGVELISGDAYHKRVCATGVQISVGE